MSSAVDLRLLADVNISPVTVKALQEADWDIVRVTDDLPADTPDLTILNAASRQPLCTFFGRPAGRPYVIGLGRICRNARPKMNRLKLH